MTPHGIFYRIERGETLYTISRIYNISLYDLMKANNIKDPEKIRVGQKIFIPGAHSKRYVPSTVRDTNNSSTKHGNSKKNVITKKKDKNEMKRQSKVVKKKRRERQVVEEKLYETDKKIIVKDLPSIPVKKNKKEEVDKSDKNLKKKIIVKKIVAKKIDSVPNFIWPVKGKVIPFGWKGSKHQDGIWIKSKLKSIVRASEGGKVYYSKRLPKYGNVVIIKHNAKLFSIYAHNSKNLVQQGKTVKRGEKIALSGKDGLYFEIRYSTVPLNPEKYLPRR